MLGIGEDGEAAPRNRKRKKRGVTFNEEEEIINPEDVDPSVGRFRNLVHTTVIPTKVNDCKIFISNRILERKKW
jgi:nuclear inhibitor of protein phosphatase 1